VIFASSITLEISRRRIRSFMGGVRDQTARPARWLYITLFLGLLVCGGTDLCLAATETAGFGLATNVSYSFFYVLTVAHALHVLGGLAGLARVMVKPPTFHAATEHHWTPLALTGILLACYGCICFFCFG